MVKPSIVPQPPALLTEAPSKPEKAIPLSGTVEPKKYKPSVKEIAKAVEYVALVPLLVALQEMCVVPHNNRSTGGKQAA